MTRIIQNREKISAYAYMGFVLLMSAAKAVGLDRTDPIYRYIGVIALLFGAVAICFTKYEKKEMLVLFLLGVYMAITCYLSHQTSPALLWFALAGAKHVDGKQIMRQLYYLWLLGFGAVVVLAGIGIIPSHYAFDRDHQTYRGDLGYNTRNMAQLVVFLVITLWGYTRKQKRVWTYLFFGAVNYAVYVVTDSRLGFYAGFISLAIWLLTDVFEKKGWLQLENKLLCIFSFIPCIFSIIIMIFGKTGNPFWDFVDKLLTHRVMILEDACFKYQVKPWGQDISGFWWIVDNAYANLLLQYGFIYFGLFMALYVWLYFKHDESFVKEKCVASLMLLCGMVEQFIQNCFMNYSLLIIIFLIWQTIRYTKNKEFAER